MQYELMPRWWRYGRPADFWLRHTKLVQKFVEMEKLTPVPDIDIPYGMPEGMRAKATADVVKWWPIPFPGGIRIAHLHLGDKLYMLERKQWQKLSTDIMGKFQEQLTDVNSVTFEQVMGLSEALDGM